MLRKYEIEQFEDDLPEYVHVNLAATAAGMDTTIRRQAAADVLQGLVSSGYEAEAMEIVGLWINKGLLIAVVTHGVTTQVLCSFSSFVSF